MSKRPFEPIEGRVFHIRPTRPDDVERLLWSGEHLRANRQRHLDLQAAGVSLVLLPTLDDTPIGHLALDLLTLRDEGGVHLHWLEVRHEYTGKGIGTALISYAEQVALARGYRLSEIAVEKINVDARRLYERLGYRLVGERLDSWLADLPDGSCVEVVDDCWVLRKILGDTSAASL